MMKSKFNLSVIVLLGAIVFWASAFAGIRAGLQHYSPTSVALGRFIVASLIFVAVAFVRGIRFPKGWDLLTVAFWGGFLSISVYHFCLNTGEETVQAGVASVIVSLSPILIAISARFLLGERLRWIQRIGIIIAFFGVILLSAGGYRFDVGILYIFIATIAASCYTVIQKKLLAKYRAIDLTACCMWFGTLFLLPYTPLLVRELETNTVMSFLPIIWLGIFPSALAYTMWAYSLRRFTANQCASTLYLSPILAFIIAWLWLGELPTYQNIIGGAVILVGIVLVNKKRNLLKPAN